MIYWTSYNFTGYLLYKCNYIPMNDILRTSFICTSLIGGYMVYIYPRRMIVRFGDKKIKIPYPLLLMGDFITHQIPLLDTIYTDNKINLCGGYLLPIMFLWYSATKIYTKNTFKIYGISLEKLLITTVGIVGSIGYYKHFIGKHIYNSFIFNL